MLETGSYLIIKLIIIIDLGEGASALNLSSEVSAIASALNPLYIQYSLYLFNHLFIKSQKSGFPDLNQGPLDFHVTSTVKCSSN